MIAEHRKMSARPSSPRETALEPLRRTQSLMRRVRLVTALLVTMVGVGQSVHAEDGGRTKFQEIPAQFIAALGEPGATSGSGAQAWGLWPLDPGPRGVPLDSYERLKAANGVAPARWQFDGTDWWLEEHGLIMEQPMFPVPPRKYVVTGAREVTTVLTIYPADKNGESRWELANGATLHDVTHLACRSARYRPTAGNGSCSPATVQEAAFPVAPGGVMPAVEGCTKQDYTVLIVIGVGVED
ncbi:MAG: hypothetical protein HOP18_21560 [Deltaproteobacteria bacterium]|nr:hypothetical protein [Deltaproteobacteria bacterium]